VVDAGGDIVVSGPPAVPDPPGVPCPPGPPDEDRLTVDRSVENDSDFSRIALTISETDGKTKSSGSCGSTLAETRDKLDETGRDSLL